mgnify:CR=1 FL=1
MLGNGYVERNVVDATIARDAGSLGLVSIDLQSVLKACGCFKPPTILPAMTNPAWESDGVAKEFQCEALLERTHVGGPFRP